MIDISNTIEVVTEINVAVDQVGGMDEFIEKANRWLDQELPD